MFLSRVISVSYTHLKYFYEILDKEFEKNRNQSLSLVLINLDDFKLYNQIYGDKQGDAALKKVGEILKATVGKSGYVARCSGKEFAIILPMFDTLGARRITDAVLQQISVMNKSVDDDADYSTRVLTASCGICTAPYGASSARELIDNADMAVYQVKRNGKNGILATTSSSVTVSYTHLDVYKRQGIRAFCGSSSRGYACVSYLRRVT